MGRRLIRIAGLAIVLGLEATASVLLHEHAQSTFITIVVIILLAAVAAALVEFVPYVLVERVPRLFGERLGNGKSVHGYWYTTIREPAGEVLGGSILLIRATDDGYEFDGYTYMKQEGWTDWGGVGERSGENEILFRYTGEEGARPDAGMGRYVFHSRDRFKGGFYGYDLGESRGEYRYVSGERARNTKQELKEWETSVEKRTDALRSHLLANSPLVEIRERQAFLREERSSVSEPDECHWA